MSTKSNFRQYYKTHYQKKATNLNTSDNRPKKQKEKNGNESNRRSRTGHKQNKDREGKKGTFASIHQEIYLPTGDDVQFDSKKKNVIMTEEVEGIELSPDKVYDFNLGHDKFIELIRPYKYLTKPPKLMIFDNYYRNHHVFSVKNKEITTSYQEDVVKSNWNGRTYERTICRHYLSEPNDLDAHRHYHLIVRIIRYLIDGQIFEIIVPREDDESPFEPDHNFWIKLFEDNHHLPKNSMFMVRRKIDRK